MASPPSGQQTWLGVGKQPSYSTRVAPAIFHGMGAFSPTSKYGFIERPETRQTAGRILAALGPYSFAGTLRAAPDPGAVEQLIAFAMGTQSVPSAAVIYSTKTTQAVTATGTQTVTVTPGTGSPNITVGSAVTFEPGGANQETVIVTAALPNSISASFAKTHANNVAVQVLGTLSQGSNYTFGAITELPYFGFTHYRVTDTYDWVGNAIDTMKISVDMGGKLVDMEFGIVGNAVAPIVNANPPTPSFVTTQPYTSEFALATYTGGAGAQLLGSAGVVPLQAISITLNNQLDKSYRTIGSQYPISFPLGMRKVSGTFKTGFENNQEFLDFLAQGTCAIALKLVSTTSIETVNGIVVPYSITFTMPTCRILQDVISQPTSGPLDQTVTFEAYTSYIGANNDLLVAAVNAATAIY